MSSTLRNKVTEHDAQVYAARWLYARDWLKMNHPETYYALLDAIDRAAAEPEAKAAKVTCPRCRTLHVPGERHGCIAAAEPEAKAKAKAEETLGAHRCEHCPDGYVLHGSCLVCEAPETVKHEPWCESEPKECNCGAVRS